MRLEMGELRICTPAQALQYAQDLVRGYVPRSSAEIRDALDPLGLEVADFEAEDAYRAGMLRPQTRGFGLSLGDRACLAPARQANLPALTADQAWEELRIGVEIRALR